MKSLSQNTSSILLLTFAKFHLTLLASVTQPTQTRSWTLAKCQQVCGVSQLSFANPGRKGKDVSQVQILLLITTSEHSCIQDAIAWMGQTGEFAHVKHWKGNFNLSYKNIYDPRNLLHTNQLLKSKALV